MTKYDNRDQGVMFPNNDKQNDSHADYGGHTEVNDVDHWLNAWVNTDDNRGGEEYLRVQLKAKEDNSIVWSYNLYQNKNKAKESHPDWKGEAEISNKTTPVAGWNRTAKSGGGEFISLVYETEARKRRKDAEKAEKAASQPVTSPATTTDEVPF